MDPSHTHHQYSTRIRQNITIKHSTHEHQSTDQLPPFPPPGIVLHTDDATSKVFIPIARAFVSVDNRAMTIKDIAERAKGFGLQCQNLSAGAQAVTTYIRAHKARCDKEDDAPLLLSHTLSGTPADDDLVPALYSRSGGDSHPLPNRLTNFRKGTAVWYLGRATGVPCPFSRAGIRLCDYVTVQEGEGGEGSGTCGSGRVRKGLRNREREEDESCGQKRKRPLRGCVARASGSDNERPPKVKLTLRLKPLLVRSATVAAAAADAPVASANGIGHADPEGSSSARPIDVSKEEEEDSYGSNEEGEDEEEDDDDDDDSMSVDMSDDQSRTAQIADKDQEEPWSLPPYPRRSISIPCYTPSVETFRPSYNNTSNYKDPYRRSPSVPYAYEATPPPDSDDEADDFHVAMARIKDYSEGEDEDEDEMGGWDADLDSEEEGETVWESPGPRSPSAPLMLPTEVAVKEEPRDVQGMLDAWEDFDTTRSVAADARMADVLAKALELERQGNVDVAAVSQNLKVKVEEPLALGLLESSDPWIWDAAEDTVRMAIKQEEDFGVHSLFPMNPPGPSSPLASLSAQFAAFSTGYSEGSSASPTTLGGSESPRPSVGMGAEWEEDMKGGAGRWDKYDTVRPRAKTVPAPMPFFKSTGGGGGLSSHSLPPQSMTRPPSQESAAHSTNLARFYQSITVNTASNLSGANHHLSTPGLGLGSGSGSGSGLGSGSSSLPPPTPCVSPLQTRCQPVSSAFPPVVVTTCQPCKPAISATQIEDISVYQMMLGAFQLSRRIDTDFVNLSPIVAFSGAALSNTTPPLTSAIPNATVITKGSPEVCGTWVPLSAAQAYVKEHLAEERARDLEVFLSDELVERFPEALREFHRSGRGNVGGRGLSLGLAGLNQFGRHFASTIQAAKLEVQVGGGGGMSMSASPISHPQPHPAPLQQTVQTTNGLTPLFVHGLGSAGRHVLEEDVDVPLSASEQQLFHELCVMPDEGLGDVEDGMDVDMDVSASVPASATASTPAGASASTSTQRPAPLDLKVDVEQDVEEPMSPLSPLPPSPAVGASSGSAVPMPMSPLILSPPVLMQECVPEHGLDAHPHPQTTPHPHPQTAAATIATDNGKPLRRSKRVADATQRQQAPPSTPSRARSRKNGSRNSLS